MRIIKSRRLYIANYLLLCLFTLLSDVIFWFHCHSNQNALSRGQISWNYRGKPIRQKYKLTLGNPLWLPGDNGMYNIYEREGMMGFVIDLYLHMWLIPSFFRARIVHLTIKDTTTRARHGYVMPFKFLFGRFPVWWLFSCQCRKHFLAWKLYA